MPSLAESRAWQAAGLCRRCGCDGVGTGRVHCPDCLKSLAAWKRDWRKGRIEAGACIDCGAPVAAPALRCPECREAERVRQRARRGSRVR
jgi:predicted amidophosphoribosyltransferase